MAEDIYTLRKRFDTPDTRLSHREQSAMTAEELAEARVHACANISNRIQILLVPILAGSLAPYFVFLLSVIAYASVFSTRHDMDKAVGDYSPWVIAATPLVVGSWALYSTLRAKYDVTERYWKTMPDQGLVDIERHTLTWAINLWSYCFDSDSSTMDRWVDGQLKSVNDSGVSQWLLARTTAGQWLVLRHAIEGAMWIMRGPETPAVKLQLHPTQDLALAFAPRTNRCLSKRFSGSPLPVAQTSLWLSDTQAQHLGEIAHHWHFFYPQRYGVVSQEDARWIDALVERARHNRSPVADLPAS
ncbi:hypothetical protein SAMN05216593_10682 [Pseudomonas asturiensis]|uniref:Uncharacterized protein n=1 Tax=Pseudomonas asturiensis TaxID=1190415 RepID=A0A1M7NJC5_9PSED|nr:hypothetical protein [Pseudomonas asturiensis]SHN03579.1 hypothetical protein SAMN05216593_10682 [Pseudomonas asturiensis]